MPEPLEQLIQQLNAAQSLGETQVCQAVEHLASEKTPAGLKAAFLAALSKKGETPEEIAAFARALRDKSIPPPIEKNWRDSREILDVVGTGGDRLSTFNISTTVAILCAAAGVAVAKHGNRAMTSSVGSADVIEELGIPVDLSPADAARALREHGFAFFFAPNFHPAFKNIAPARKLCAENGQRTIFNILGPLLNPARPSAMLVGVPRPELCEPMARALQSLGTRRGMVVCGSVESKVQSPRRNPIWQTPQSLPRRSHAKTGAIRNPHFFWTSFRRSAQTRSLNFITSAVLRFQLCRRKITRCNRRRWPICGAATKS